MPYLDLTRGPAARIILYNQWRIRLEAQDIALSRRRHGFESRIRYQARMAPGNRFPGALFVYAMRTVVEAYS